MAQAAEQTLTQLEQALGALGDGLRLGHLAQIETSVAQLQRALSQVHELLGRRGQSGPPLPPRLRMQLELAKAQAAALHDGAARGQASACRALAVLLPDSAPSLYGEQGSQAPAQRFGHLQA